MRGVGRSATLPGLRACRVTPRVQASPLPRCGRRYSTRNIRQRSRRPLTPAIGQHPSSDRPSASLRGGHLLPQGEKDRLPEPLPRTCRPIVRGSNLGAAGRAEWTSEFHAMWTDLARCGCRLAGTEGLTWNRSFAPLCPADVSPNGKPARSVSAAFLVCIAATFAILPCIVFSAFFDFAVTGVTGRYFAPITLYVNVYNCFYYAFLTSVIDVIGVTGTFAISEVRPGDCLSQSMPRAHRSDPIADVAAARFTRVVMSARHPLQAEP